MNKIKKIIIIIAGIIIAKGGIYANANVLIKSNVIAFKDLPYTYSTYGPSWCYDYNSTLDNGESVKIITSKDNWSEIDYNNKKSWVESDRITPVNMYSEPIDSFINFVGEGYDYTCTTSGPGWEYYFNPIAKNGYQAYILGEYNDWYLIKYQGRKTWVNKDRIAIPNYLNKTGIIDFKQNGYVYTCTTWGPDWSYGVKATLNNGTIVHIDAEYKNWYRINYNGSLYWVLKDRVDTNINLIGKTTHIYFGQLPYTSVQTRPEWGYDYFYKNIDNDTLVTIIGEKGDWYRIKLNNEETAWVLKDRTNDTLKYAISDFPYDDHTDCTNNPGWNTGYAGSLKNGTKVLIIEKQGDWTEINYNGKNLWVMSDRLIDSDDYNEYNNNTQELAYIDSDTKANIYYSPAMKIVATTNTFNQPVTILGRKDNIYLIRTVNNFIGYVPAKNISYNFTEHAPYMSLFVWSTSPNGKHSHHILYNDIYEKVSELCQGKTTQNAMAWAIFNWCGENIKYDYSDDSIGKSPEWIFQNRKAVCSGYASLYAYMCELAGIRTQILYGDVPAGESAGHAWNKIFLSNGKTFQVDTCWYKIYYTSKYYYDNKMLFSEDKFHTANVTVETDGY